MGTRIQQQNAQDNTATYRCLNLTVGGVILKIDFNYDE
jgi:hypothetical protein